MKTTEQIVEEFRQMAFPIVHSNTFPHKDAEYLERLISFFRQTLLSDRQRIEKEIQLAIAEEINIARSEEQPTSRLTSLAMKIYKLLEE